MEDNNKLTFWQQMIVGFWFYFNKPKYAALTNLYLQTYPLQDAFFWVLTNF